MSVRSLALCLSGHCLYVCQVIGFMSVRSLALFCVVLGFMSVKCSILCLNVSFVAVLTAPLEAARLLTV